MHGYNLRDFISPPLKIYQWGVSLMATPQDLSPPNRMSSTIDGNRKIDQLCTTSNVSNEKRKTTCPPISWYTVQDSMKINIVFVGIRKKYLQLKIR